MYIKKIRHICDVRGCKNTDTFTVSRTREMGNSIIICADCAKELLAAIGEYDPKKAEQQKQAKPPKLFFNEATKKPKTVRKAQIKSSGKAANTKAENVNEEE